MIRNCQSRRSPSRLEEAGPSVAVFSCPSMLCSALVCRKWQRWQLFCRLERPDRIRLTTWTRPSRRTGIPASTGSFSPLLASQSHQESTLLCTLCRLGGPESEELDIQGQTAAVLQFSCFTDKCLCVGAFFSSSTKLLSDGASPLFPGRNMVLAERCALLSAEILKSQGKYSETATLLIKMTSEVRNGDTPGRLLHFSGDAALLLILYPRGVLQGSCSGPLRISFLQL